MSRDLEREYRALVNSEVPDLWARIEAGLEDKKMAPETAGTAASDLHITDFSMPDAQREQPRIRKANFRVWAGIAAACACVALVVPAMLRAGMSKGGSYSNSAPNFAADTAPQSADSSGGAEDNAGREEMAYEYGNEKSDFLQGNAQTTMDSDMNGAGAADGAQMMEEAAAAEEPESESYSFHATVEILETDLRMDSGILYTAKVLSSDNSAIAADSEIRIFSSAVSAEGVTRLEVSQTYDLVLCEDHSGEMGQEPTYLLIDE